MFCSWISYSTAHYGANWLKADKLTVHCTVQDTVEVLNYNHKIVQVLI